MHFEELFRVMIGSASGPCKSSDVRNKIQSMTRCVAHILRPLKLTDRLEFLEAFQATDSTNWLVVVAKSTPQLILFEEIECALIKGAERHTPKGIEHQESLAFKAMQLAFLHLQELSNVGRWMPARLDQWLRETEHLRVELKWPLEPSASIGLLSPHNHRVDFFAAELPRRVTLDTPVLVHFHVEMIGHEKASVILTRATRRELRIRRRTIELHWWKAVQQNACLYLENAWQKCARVRATVYVTVNKNRDCIALQLDAIEPPIAGDETQGCPWIV